MQNFFLEQHFFGPRSWFVVPPTILIHFMVFLVRHSTDAEIEDDRTEEGVEARPTGRNWRPSFIYNSFMAIFVIKQSYRPQHANILLHLC